MRGTSLQSVAAAIAFGGASLLGAAQAGEWDLGLEIGAELRYFPNEPTFAQQFEHWQPSITFQPDIRWDSDDGKHQIVFIPFGRIDSQDDERTHFDVREGYYRYVSDGDWTLLIGAAKVFWGTTESRHLVDVINQVDGVEDIDEEDRLGQPMVNLTLLKDWGQLDLYVLPGFRTRKFPGPEGRLRFAIPIDDDNPLFERDWGRGAVDFAARYSNFFGNWDVGLSFFHGTAREPRLADVFPGGVTPLPPSPLPLTPVYDRITQGGIDFQYTTGAWLFKGEAIVRDGQGETFFAGVGGFEYTIYQIFGRSWDLGILSEYLYDGRDEGFGVEQFAGEIGAIPAAPFTVFQNDIFAGARLAFNDTQDSSVLAGITTDIDDGSKGVFIEGQRRFGENWTAELEGRFFFDADPANISAIFADDDFLTFRLTRYF